MLSPALSTTWLQAAAGKIAGRRQPAVSRVRVRTEIRGNLKTEECPFAEALVKLLTISPDTYVTSRAVPHNPGKSDEGVRAKVVTVYRPLYRPVLRRFDMTGILRNGWPVPLWGVDGESTTRARAGLVRYQIRLQCFPPVAIR